MKLLNRSAIVVMPGQQFLEWPHRVDPTSGHLRLGDLHLEPSIYLLPDSDEEVTFREDLRKVCAEIFKDQLDGWYRDRSVWPTCLDLETFNLWFEYRAHSMLIDACDGPLKRENF